MIKYKIVLIVFFVFNSALSQDKNFVKKNLFKINLLSPGITYERGLNRVSTFCFDTNFSIGLSASSSSKLKVLASPFIRGQYRYYYNIKKRELKGRNISKNSAEFIALSSSYYFKTIDNEKLINYLDGITISALWGFQKTYKSNINLTANAGLGYNLSSNQTNRVVPVINFTIGWVIGK